MIKIIVGFLICVFGLIGFAVEYDNSLETGSWDYFGLALSAVLIYAGGALFYYGIVPLIRKKRDGTGPN